MNRRQVLTAAVLGLALAITWRLKSRDVFGQSQQNVQVPKFRYDPNIPQPLPERWTIGGMVVESYDHIWVPHRPSPWEKNERFTGTALTPLRADRCIPAPLHAEPELLATREEGAT